MRSRFALIVATTTVLGLTVGGILVWRASQPRDAAPVSLPPPPTPQEQVATLVKELESPETPARDNATESLSKLPQEALPLMEATLARTDLPPQVRERLQQAAARHRWRTRQHQERQSLDAWYQSTLTGPYEKVGSRSPKWDDDARETLDALVEALKCDNPMEKAARARGSIETAHRALTAGCDDGVVIYAAAMLQQLAGAPASSYANQLQTAVTRIREQGAYPPARLTYALLRAGEAARQANPTRALALVEQAIDSLPATLADPQLPRTVVEELPWELVTAHFNATGDRLPGFQRVEAALAKSLPESHALYLLRGRFYVKYAWDARGSDFAQNVPADAWPKFNDRLAKADAALTRAHEIDPGDCKGPDLMLTVELGQGKGKDRMELWYARALAANPNNMGAAHAKMNYLDPKWHGSFDEMLAFGRDLVRQGNWEAGLPSVLVSVHGTIAHYTAREKTGRWEPDGDYLAQDAVWAEMQPIFEQAVTRSHGNPQWASMYALFAYKGRHWKDADRALQLLGDGPVEPRLIPSHAALARMRDDVARHLANPTPEPSAESRQRL